MIYGFWNNKGGTGKTSLAFQVICRYAHQHPDKHVLAVDMCPQANMSELFLGGLTQKGSKTLLQRHGLVPRCSIGGYFQQRLSAPFNPPTLASEDFVTHPHDYKHHDTREHPSDLWRSDVGAASKRHQHAANAQIPGTDTWISIIDWLHDLLTRLKKKYEPMFLDTNPSFSIYTQIALSKVERLILPVMADDSSRRAIQNALSLIYGLKLPSEIYSAYAFATKLQKAKRSLPRVHIVAKNRLTQYMGPASAYDAVLKSIEKDIKSLIKLHPEHFTFKTIGNGVVDIRDFQTTGVVAFAKGCPFYSMPTGKLDIGGRRVQVNATNKQNCVEAIDTVTAKLA